MAALTVHTGCQGDQTTVYVQWFDHNNRRHVTEIVMAILPQDKPRTLEVRINGQPVYRLPVSGSGWGDAADYVDQEPASPLSRLYALWAMLGQELPQALALPPCEERGGRRGSGSE